MGKAKKANEDEAELGDNDVRTLVEVKCTTCEGSGRVYTPVVAAMHEPRLGSLERSVDVQTMDCPKCEGTGWIERKFLLSELRELTVHGSASIA